MPTSSVPFFPPKRTRTHEACGPGAYMFACATIAHLGGQAMWIAESWNTNKVNPNGVADFVDPAKLIFCNTKDQSDTLAVAEDALRSGAVSLVVVVLSKPLGLTEGRRLQLAARDGRATGLAIIPEGMGSNAAETRWHCSPVFDAAFDAGPLRRDSTLQRWELIKNKSGTFGVWHVRWDSTAHRISVASPPRE